MVFYSFAAFAPGIDSPWPLPSLFVLSVFGQWMIGYCPLQDFHESIGLGQSTSVSPSCFVPWTSIGPCPLDTKWRHNSLGTPYRHQYHMGEFYQSRTYLTRDLSRPPTHFFEEKKHSHSCNIMDFQFHHNRLSKRRTRTNCCQ